MKMNIEERDLELLIEKKKDYIGVKEWGTFGVIDSLLLILSTYTAQYDGLAIPSKIIKLFFYLFATFQLCYAVIQVYKKIFRNYTEKDLLDNIKELHMVERSSSIIAIKNNINPEKLLVYDDKDWGVQFFPNYTTVTGNNLENLRRRLSEDLGVSEKDIILEHNTAKDEEKFSSEHKEERLYHYEFYRAKINTKDFKNDFSRSGRMYHWKSISELLNNEKVKKYNRFVVEQVRDFLL